ncbi:MAG: hypothetical protein HYW86_01230 [Candidatus Roizmanbacteria bacterium]|nr:MAG: hypothetical protein HYW86_01230 [Candidatus Roizmanbacteria bacterium]
MNNIVAQGLKIVPSVGAGTPQPASLTLTGPLKGINTIGDVVNRISQFLIPLAAVILFIVLVYGGYQFLLSQGNPEKVKSARAILTAGVIGFILLIISFTLVKLISFILGLDTGII